LLLGHRGARRSAPENTLRAFELALEQGADGFELDVRLDGDGRVIVFHDRSLERVTEGRDRRLIEDVSGVELASVDISGERVPTLVEVLDWAAARGTRVNVEVKRDVSHLRRLVADVARQVAVSRARESTLLSSFHPGVVLMLGRLLPELPVCWLVHEGQRILREAPAWRYLGASGVNPEMTIASPKRLARWQHGGALVGVWTVNDAAAARALSELGVDILISDVPAELRSVL
jgi:glycerophosphoryl diester phosphodiesterase